MKKTLALVLFGVCSMSASAQDGWALFAKTKFDAKYSEKAGGYFLMPTFPEDLKALDGKEFTLEGYFLPVTVEGDDYIILSKFPYAQCFFCGGAGPESIAEVYLKGKEKFEPDQYIRIKGKLKLNESDIDHGNFMIQAAEVVRK